MLNDIRIRGKYALLVRILQDHRRIGRIPHIPFVYDLYTKLLGPVFGSLEDFVDQHHEEAHRDRIVELWPRYRNMNHYEQHAVLNKRLLSSEDAILQASPLYIKSYDPYADEVDKDISSSNDQGEIPSDHPPASSAAQSIESKTVQDDRVIHRTDPRDINERSSTAQKKSKSKEVENVLPSLKDLLEFHQWCTASRKLNDQTYTAKFKYLVWVLYDAQVQRDHPQVTDSMWVFGNLRRRNDPSLEGKEEEDAWLRLFPSFLERSRERRSCHR